MKIIQNVIGFLYGRKTYICTVILGILGVLVSVDTISWGDTWVKTVVAVVGALTGVALRAGVTKASY